MNEHRYRLPPARVVEQLLEAPGHKDRAAKAVRRTAAHVDDMTLRKNPKDRAGEQAPQKCHTREGLQHMEGGIARSRPRQGRVSSS